MGNISTLHPDRSCITVKRYIHGNTMHASLSFNGMHPTIVLDHSHQIQHISTQDHVFGESLYIRKCEARHPFQLHRTGETKLSGGIFKSRRNVRFSADASASMSSADAVINFMDKNISYSTGWNPSNTKSFEAHM